MLARCTIAFRKIQQTGVIVVNCRTLLNPRAIALGLVGAYRNDAKLIEVREYIRGLENLIAGLVNG